MLDGRAFAQHHLACPDCGAPMRLLVSREGGPPYYGCSRFAETRCPGAHGADLKGAPLGVPGNRATRDARRRAHDAFDPLWRELGMDRGAAYRLLEARMGLGATDGHIGRMTIEQCEQVIAIMAPMVERLRRARGRGSK